MYLIICANVRVCAHKHTLVRVRVTTEAISPQWRSAPWHQLNYTVTQFPQFSRGGGEWISISLGLGSAAIHQAINQKRGGDRGREEERGRVNAIGSVKKKEEEASWRCTASTLESWRYGRVKAARTLIKINAHISQVDGMFGTVYNTQV